jgi:hypothetical protein
VRRRGAASDSPTPRGPGHARGKQGRDGESIPTRPELGEEQAQHPIVTEELELLERVTAMLEQRLEPRTAPEQSIVRELERLRELLDSSGDRGRERSSIPVHPTSPI